jgi:hypothetical protein
METFYGVVEDRHDPMMVGRVRVRIHGLHSEEKTQISTPDLPWSTVILPTTSAGLTGFGTQHGLVEGSSVYGFFRDGKSQQDPVITGVVAGIPVQGYKKDANGNLIKRKVTIGFSDPRRLTTSEYTGTPDGTTPSHNPRRTYGLTASLEDAPQIPDERKTPGHGLSEQGTSSQSLQRLRKTINHITHIILMLLIILLTHEVRETTPIGILDSRGRTYHMFLKQTQNTRTTKLCSPNQDTY